MDLPCEDTTIIFYEFMNRLIHNVDKLIDKVFQKNKSMIDKVFKKTKP